MTTNTILLGNNIETLKTIPADSVDCYITSPPYYGLRDYKTEGQIGLEETPEKYIDKLVTVFREVKRILRDDGTLWVVIADSYAGSGKAAYDVILKEGVKKYSFWTPFLSAALTMGGPYVVAVDFPEITDEWVGLGGWQYICERKIKPQDFISTLKYHAELLTYNPIADRKMRKRWQKQEGKKWCNNCDGRGETTYLNDGHWWLISGSRFDSDTPSRSGPIEMCPKCLGGTV